MHVWKMVVAVGVVALAVAGCGSDDSDGELDKETVRNVGESATVPVSTDETGKELSKLEITTTAVVKGAIEDLADYQLDAKTKASEPYYVTMKFRNVGDKPADTAGLDIEVTAYSTGKDQLTRLTLGNKDDPDSQFEKCPGEEAPESLAAGAEFTWCRVHALPSGQTFGDVRYNYLAGTVGDDYFMESGTVYWKAG